MNMKTDENRKIIEMIETIISDNPQLRFNQILHSLNIVNCERSTFYDEPEDVVKRIKDSGLYKNDNRSSKGVYWSLDWN